MQYIFFFLVACALMLLTACTHNKKDYEASATCQNMGYSPGTADYDQCVEDETMRKAMEQQREDYERMQQYQQDQKMMHY